MEWLRSAAAPPGAVELREELAYLLFHGNPTWANNDSSVSDYRDILSQWFADDADSESTFIRLTSQSNCAEVVAWFAPVVERWKQWAKTNEGAAEKGFPNPGYAADQTPGTQYYRYDPDNEVYLYASTPDAADGEWLSYEDRRYTPVSYDDGRKTNYRQDMVTGDYEFQSWMTPARWLTAAEWDQEVSAPAGGTPGSDRAGDPLCTVPVYDAGFQMYRRFNSARAEYEYADDAASESWLSLDEATVRHQGRQGIAGPASSAGSASPGARGEVIPVSAIPGWDHLAGEAWAQGWYALPAEAGYTYLHSPGGTPTAQAPGWSDVPPAPPVQQGGHPQAPAATHRDIVRLEDSTWFSGISAATGATEYLDAADSGQAPAPATAEGWVSRADYDQRSAIPRPLLDAPEGWWTKTVQDQRWAIHSPDARPPDGPDLTGWMSLEEARRQTAAKEAQEAIDQFGFGEQITAEDLEGLDIAQVYSQLAELGQE